MEKSKMKVLSSKHDSDKISSESDTITIPGLAELSQRVGENTSDIKHLKEKSEVVSKMDARITGIETKQQLFEKKLDKLDQNDSSIESGIATFRYWLVGGLAAFIIIMCGAIWTSLTYGLDQYSKDKTELKSELTDSIDKVEKESKDRHVIVDKKLDMIYMLMVKENK
jgi:hypothetical protein